MEMYDLVVVGGGIGGSVAARFSAANGFKTLLVEQAKVPRNKVCTGLQFTYFENLIGAKIPSDKLCRNELDTMQMILPSERNFSASMELLNFWRINVDHWLNELAAAEGAIFHDETIYIHHEEESGRIAVTLEAHGQQRKVFTRYVIGADGANSRVREVIRPQDFNPNAKGGIWVYYVEGSSLLDEKTVYMFYNVDFATHTFGTVYRKDDEWLIATGADHAPEEYIERFYTYIKQKYLLTGEITRRESFASTMAGGPYLGTGNLLMVGDAAGLLDPYRMLGMDNAALSGRLAIKSILIGEKLNRPVLNCYQDEMQDILESLAEGAQKQEARYTNNDTLEASMTSPEFLLSGLKTVTGEMIDRHLPPEDIITLPE